jgi:hypothetical protein
MAVLMGSIKSKFDNFTTTFSFLYAIEYIATKKSGNSQQIEIKKSISKKLNLSPNASYGSYAYKLYNELVKIGAKSSSDAALRKYDLKIDNQKRIIKK